MILNLKLPKEIEEEFKRLFDREVDEYWNPFQGWLWGNCTGKLLEDYPTLEEAQDELLGKIINHEAQVFDEFGKWAELELHKREHHPFRKSFENYPPSMIGDIIEKDFD